MQWNYVFLHHVKYLNGKIALYQQNLCELLNYSRNAKKKLQTCSWLTFPKMCQYLHILSLLTIFSIVNFECLLNSNELSNYKTAFIVFDGIGHKTNENIFQELFFAKRCMTNLNKKWARGFQNETIFMGIQRTIFLCSYVSADKLKWIGDYLRKLQCTFSSQDIQNN